MNVTLEEITDASLLKRYLKEGSENAFAEIVRRRLPLVFGTALRRLGGDHAGAKDVAQTVFVALAKQAGTLAHHPALAGWLYTTAVHQANDQLRRRKRRQTQEQTLMTNANLNPSANVNWEQLQPILDDAMQDLSDEDRHAVVLRYFEQRPFPAIGRELGLNDDAARMRVSRALEKLKARLAARGLASSVAAIGEALANQPATVVPAGLAASIRNAIQVLPGVGIGGPAFYGPVWKLSIAALSLLAVAGGARFIYLQQTGIDHKSPSTTRISAASLSSSNRPHARLPFGKTASSAGAFNSVLERGLGYLRSGLFDAHLGNAERYRLIEESAGLLVGYEKETVPLFREALHSPNPVIVNRAVDSISRFGPTVKEFGPEFLALLANPNFKDESGTIANRLVFALGSLERPVASLLTLLQQRPDLQEHMIQLLETAIHSDPARLAGNRGAVAALLNSSNLDLHAVAQKVLAETPEPPPPLTREAVEGVVAKLGAAQASQRQHGLEDALKLGRFAPEIRDGIVDRLLHDSVALVRVEARLVLQKLAADDPALTSPETTDPVSRDQFLARLVRKEVPVPELIEALGNRPNEIPEICENLSQKNSAYWFAHPEEKWSAVQCLAALYQNRDARIYEAAAEAYTAMNGLAARPFYRMEELQPFFDAMEANLKPGEYAIAMRDFKPSAESYWKSRGFIQPEPTHLPADDIRTLLTGPYHENRPAYDAMLQAIQQIDPKFLPPTP